MARGGKLSRRAIYQRLDEAAEELHSRFGGLPTPAQAADVWAGLWHRDAHHSTALEGNTLALFEVERLLERGETTTRKSLSEYVEVKGYADAAKWVYAQALTPDEFHNGELVTMREVRHIHHLMMGLLWTIYPHPHATDAEAPGSFRQHQIAAFPQGMKPPSWTEVDSLMRGWVDDVCAFDTPSTHSFIEAVAHSHHRFEQIHPFLDGNGRTGRLLLNLMLVRSGYPPAIIEKKSRQRYLNALTFADRGNIGPLAELLARAVIDSLHQFVLPAVASEIEMVPLAVLADERFGEESLRTAARRGRLRAFKAKTGWLSTREWLDEYRASRYRRD